MKHKLDDAVVLQGGQGDQLRSCSDNDPESRMLNEVHGWLADIESLRLLALTANVHFQSPNAPFKIR